MTTWNDEQAAAIEALFNSGVTPEQFVALYARVIEERPEVGNAHVKDVIGKDRTGVRIGGERGERSTHFESKYPGSTVSCVAAIIRQGENGPEMLAGKRSDSRLTLPGGHLLAPVPSELRELEAGSDKSMKEIIRDSLETPAASTHEEDARRLHVTLDQAMTDELIQETGMAFVPKSLDEAGKSKFIENAKESFGEEIIIVQDYDIVAKTAFGEPHDYREGDKRFLTEIGFAIHVHDPAVQRLPQELAGSDDLEEGGLRWMPQHEITRELLDSARNFTHGKTPAVEAAWQKLFDSMEIAVRLDNQDILYIKPAAMEQAIEEVAGRFGHGDCIWIIG